MGRVRLQVHPGYARGLRVTRSTDPARLVHSSRSRPRVVSAMTTMYAGSPSYLFAQSLDVQYCPRCSHRRAGQLRLCGYCRFDFETPDPADAAPTGPPTPAVRLVPSDEPLPAGTSSWGRGKRWLLLGPIAAM
jgi:hypothetical protein